MAVAAASATATAASRRPAGRKTGHDTPRVSSAVDAARGWAAAAHPFGRPRPLGRVALLIVL
jgi:hypothetical protein